MEITEMATSKLQHFIDAACKVEDPRELRDRLKMTEIAAAYSEAHTIIKLIESLFPSYKERLHLGVAVMHADVATLAKIKE
jgi:hypothetical protein